MISILPHIRIVLDKEIDSFRKRDGKIHRKRVLPDSPIVGFSYGCLTKINHLNFGVHVSMNNYGQFLETSSKQSCLCYFTNNIRKNTTPLASGTMALQLVQQWSSPISFFEGA